MDGIGKTTTGSMEDETGSLGCPVVADDSGSKPIGGWLKLDCVKITICLTFNS